LDNNVRFLCGIYIRHNQPACACIEKETCIWVGIAPQTNQCRNSGVSSSDDDVGYRFAVECRVLGIDEKEVVTGSSGD
jgi:hypothetical protein